MDAGLNTKIKPPNQKGMSMNTKLQELVKQATTVMVGRGEFAGKEFHDFDKEKFALIIIRECANIADDNFNAGFCPVGNFILEHFGVEE